MKISTASKRAEKYKSDPLISGVVEAFPMEGTIELARSLRKNATRVVVITDNSVSGSGSAKQAMAEQADFPDLKFELFDTSAMTSGEIQDRISLYGDDTILLYTVFNVDGTGRRYTLAQGIKLITDAAGIPVFKADEAGLGDGLAGGYMLSYQSIGQETSDMVIAALNGTKFEKNYVYGSCIYQFDQQVLDRFGISEAQLPRNSVLINQAPTFFEKYQKPVILFACGAAVLLAVTLLLSEARKRKLRRDLEVEERANRAKTEFISRMSHDIRTPLNAILGMDRLALEDAGDPGKVREYLGKAETSGKLLNSLINDILDVSRIESGKMKLDPVPYSLRDFFENIRSVFGNLCAEKGIAFTVTESADDVTVLADQVRLNQLFYNLLTNAVKFTEKGGKIRFGLESDVRDGLMHCVFTVSDTGCGMSQEFQRHMYEQFSQEGKKDVQGSGLGLSIAKSITDLMGGSISADSAPGAGTTFRVSLDLQVAGPAADGGAFRRLRGPITQNSGERGCSLRRIMRSTRRSPCSCFRMPVPRLTLQRTEISS
jgi:signal transduction histidine kinase